jgi:hypothetical protein
VQLPLAKGDAAFFNPALFHGTNLTADVCRMANLLHVCSAFGRAMETVDRTAVSRALFPVLAARLAAGANEASIRNVIAASAEAYAFPTNLDRDPSAPPGPMGRIGQVSENRGVRVFLRADRSGVVTGSVIEWDQTCSATTTRVTRTLLLSY